jgi:hypothetical protein
MFISITKNLMDINKIIDIIHTLKEEGESGGAPTNSLVGGKIAGTVEAGDSPPVDLRKGRRRNWNPFFKNLARIQRRPGK